MGFFECCHYCKPPKRYPGCHDKCPDYKEQKRLWDERKEAEKQAKSEEPWITHAHRASLRRSRYKH